MRHRRRHTDQIRLSGFQLGVLSIGLIILTHLGSGFFPATQLRATICQTLYAVAALVGFWSVARYDDHPY